MILEVLLDKIEKASAFVREQIGHQTPLVGLILGSGLGQLADEITDPIKISYRDIPGFPVSTVKGHEGQLVFGEINGKHVLAMQGRFHFYEGYSLREVTFPVRVMKSLGIGTMIVTNAAGGINRSFRPGELMVIHDHINFGFSNPLIGGNLDQYGPRFPDTSEAYDPHLQALAMQTANDLALDIKTGVYQFATGPTYETPAETKVSEKIGADAVGMSTVPEVLVAVHSGMKVLGISCISNMASGILDQPLNHEEVIETTGKVKNNFISLIKGVIAKL